MSDIWDDPEVLEFSNALAMFTGDSWDTDSDSQEGIVLRFVEHCVGEVRRLGGCLRQYCGWSEGEPCDHDYLTSAADPPARGVGTTPAPGKAR